MADDPAPPVAGAIEVVAAVITDTRGRVLLTRRTAGRDLAGLWEFPGGKREPGESPEAALARELHEELGIEAEVGEPVITVPHAYPHKRLRLDVRHLRDWRGTARGREGQALAWVPSHKLASYAMPPADRPVVAALLDPPEYLVTPAPGGDADSWLSALEAALAGGVRRVQLRSRPAEAVAGAGPVTGIDATAIAGSRDSDVGVHEGDGPVAAADGGAAGWATLVARAVQLCRDAGAEVLVNADAALAREHGIGLHLPAAALVAAQGVRPVPPEVPLAASCHDLDELKAAEALGCDFAVVGNIRETPSHPGRPGIGWSGFARLREHVAIPLYAIGGLAPADVDEARLHGAQGVAAIRGLWPA